MQIKSHRVDEMAVDDDKFFDDSNNSTLTEMTMEKDSLASRNSSQEKTELFTKSQLQTIVKEQVRNLLVCMCVCVKGIVW